MELVGLVARSPVRRHAAPAARLAGGPSDGLGLRGLAFMEGGPEASLVVDVPGAEVREMGSYEDGFYPSDDNHEFWDLPNVVGFERR